MNVETVAHELARDGFEHAFGKPVVAATADGIWRAVRDTGTRLWLDIHVASEDGKIPVYEHWKDRLASGDIGLDALMNLSAFRSFASDQAALDARIRSHIK